MRKGVIILFVIATMNVLAAGAWAANGSQRRAKEITSAEGSFKIRAGGVLNKTVEVYDGNDIGKADLDFGIIEDHRDAFLQLGFASVHVKTAKGETLDRPL
jgi:hypothetical protein